MLRLPVHRKVFRLHGLAVDFGALECQHIGFSIVYVADKYGNIAKFGGKGIFHAAVVALNLVTADCNIPLPQPVHIVADFSDAADCINLFAVGDMQLCG